MRFLDAGTALPEDTLVLPHTLDVQSLQAQIAGRRAIALQFPKWTDGRAYSQAVLLRSRLRFAGELIATGDVLADMLPLLRRCGFDAVQLRTDQSIDSARRALGFLDGRAPAYQSTAAERVAPASSTPQPPSAETAP